MRRLLVLVLATLAACGGTLYTSEGLPALPATGNQCTDPQAPMSCPDAVNGGTFCAAHDEAHCASCTDACAAGPSDGQQRCLETATGIGDWACRLVCNPGWLRTGTTCTPPSAVAAGDAHACAVAGGTLKCWGANGSGQVSGAPTSGAVHWPVDLASGVTLVAAGGTSTCAVAGGQVSCWGTVASPATLTGATALAVGARHACALLASGALACWGTGAAATAAPGGTGWAALSSGADHACALDTSGAVTCWGSNARQQLGTTGAAATSHQVFASGIAALGAGHDQGCAAESTGRVFWCWGDDAAPAQVSRVNLDAVEIAVGRAHVCVRKAGEGARCFGDNALGQLGQANVNAGELSTVPGAVGDWRLAAGADHTCALLPGGTAQCWGANGSAQLGGGTAAAVPIGTTVTVSGR